MDFEAKIREDREMPIEDLKKLVSIDSVEAAPKEGMPFGEGAAESAAMFSGYGGKIRSQNRKPLITMQDMRILGTEKKHLEFLDIWMLCHVEKAGYAIRFSRKSSMGNYMDAVC